MSVNAGKLKGGSVAGAEVVPDVVVSVGVGIVAVGVSAEVRL